MFKKILIANRGEIACRLIRAGRELGAVTVAVYSEVDQGAVWARQADESYLLPGAKAEATYLNQARILEVAKACGADAIHPGYGFLSENPAFAALCQGRGIHFIGPSPAAMRALGDKAEARRIAEKAGVPVAPGVDGAGRSDDQLQQAAAELGYPIMIKASGGGGGKGMRLVREAAGLPQALQAARLEAQSAFGDDHILLERYFEQVRHVEVQVLGDEYGDLIHLFERECSLQRRHQKVFEESPSPAVTSELRARLTGAALALARAAGYSSAGTVEFMLAPDGHFYFLEMNTRLQVEHPVTELVAGVDLAAWQIRLAAGERLDVTAERLTQRGHALEARIYAEDPAHDFLPSTGEIGLYRPPAAPGVRVDDGVENHSQVTPFY
ncbi:MAG: acetyl-CoA carboxylase biotin carboxylase subunit, partial [Candidatus Promineifilaceae bacterium]